MKERNESYSAERIATLLKALGEPTRLRIFQFLRQCCCPVAVDEETGEVRPLSGPTVGEVCCHLTGSERVTSTISEHLKELRIAGVVVMEERGRFTVCAINPLVLRALSEFFQDEGSLSDADNGCAC